MRPAATVTVLRDEPAWGPPRSARPRIDRPTWEPVTAVIASGPEETHPS
jgi:hypothetical protein